MEKIIYILVPIAYFFYQAYNNYVKEQEKARKRNLSQPVIEIDIPQTIVKEEPVQFDVKEFLKEKFNLETERKEIIKTQTRTIPEYQTKDYYNPEVPAAEVIENRKIRAPHEHNVVFPVSEEQEKPYAFNLRDAIIQQAILNRPYKD